MQSFAGTMLILKNRQELSDFVRTIKGKNLTLGFVPTMGALHEGHLALIKRSIEENQYTVCSIFVNPTQFNDASDLEKYPRTEEADMEKLRAEGCDAVYFPRVEDLYPNGLENDPIDLGGIDQVMEGAFRSGHFAGVATVVSRLFMQVQPTRAYFGEKDFQQIQVIRKMVKEKKLPVEIVPVPIVRAENGLALSSRNTRLTPDFKEKSTFLYQTLLAAKSLAAKLPSKEIVKQIEKMYAESDLKLEYFIIAGEDTLQTADVFEPQKHYRAFVAAYAGSVRLIDNLRIL